MYHHPHDAPGLSLFEQTMREKDDEFYKTFPAARIAFDQWRPAHHSTPFLPGCGFQLHDPLSYDYPYDHHSQQLSPVDAPPTAASPLLHLPPSAYHHHQPVPSPHNDPAPYHAPPQQQYYNASPPFTAPMASPVHQDLPVPLSPPALVQATYAYDITTAQPDHPQFFVDSQPSPQIPPSRRNSHHLSHRSQRRWSPQYNRPSHLTHKSGGSGGIPIQAIGWPSTEPPPPTSTLSPNPAIGFNINNTNVGVAAAAVAQAAATAAAASATAVAVVAATAPPAPASDPSSSPPVFKAQLAMPPPPNSPTIHSPPIGGGNKRNPDKKPALACVFCRGRKIACGPPLKDGDGKTCNQCQRRSLRCEYPTESRRGMRKKPAANATPSNSASSSTSPSTTDPTNNTTGNTTKNPKPNTNPDKSKATTNKK